MLMNTIKASAKRRMFPPGRQVSVMIFCDAGQRRERKPSGGETRPRLDKAKDAFMSRSRLLLFSLILLCIGIPMGLRADTNCEEGNGALNPAQPQGATTDEVIRK